VVRVVLEGGANVERADTVQWNALHTAALYGHLDVCRLLLDWGAKVDPVNGWKCTSLHYAALTGHLSMVKLLVEKGAVRIKNDNGQTASDVARSEGYSDLAH
jgi:ankyrin repeat protein